MSQENVDDVLRGIAAWNSRDLDGWLASIDPDWELTTSGIFPGLQPSYRGVNGARQLWNDMRGPWEDFRICSERTQDLGDSVLSLITFEVRGRDGLPTSRRWAHVYRYDGPKQVRTENYESWDQALKAVGLEE
jgi:ketosteroid isomerase-like protein